MNYAHYNVPQPAPEPADGGSIVNYRAVRNWLRFAVRSLKKHKRVVFGVAAVVLGLAALTVIVMPKRYHIETHLLAQRNLVLALPGEESGGRSPSNAAVETILKRDNLVALVKDSNLLDEWSTRRAPILRLKDLVSASFTRQPTEAERVDGFVKYLRKQLKVVNDDTIGSVAIEINWPDGRMGYRLVESAQRNYLEARHVEETSAIAESAAILEGHAAELRRDIDTAVKEIQALRAKKQAEREEAAPAANKRALEKEAASQAVAAAAPAPAPAPEKPAPAQPKLDDFSVRRLSELPVVIEAKRSAIHELEEFRQRRVAELQAQLEDKRASYTDEHPAIADLKHSIAAASHESTQVKNLRNELRQLEGEYQQLSGKAASAGENVARATGAGGARGMRGSGADRGLPGDVIRIEQEPAEERDPEIEYARARLKHSIASYQDLEQRIQRASIDLDTAEAAFKYRYKVVSPPEIPKGPVFPNVPLVLIGALFAGLFLGLFAAVGLDLKRGVLSEPWQVEQFLSLPVLANVSTRPELTGP